MFARIEHVRDASGDFWEVRTKDGLRTRYGTPRPDGAPVDWQDPAAVADPRRPDRVAGWRITETRDPLGNVVRYDYLADRGEEPGHVWNQPSIARISYADYGDQAAPSFLVQVEFGYEPRPDPFSNYRSFNGTPLLTRWTWSGSTARSRNPRHRDVRVLRLRAGRAPVPAGDRPWPAHRRAERQDCRPDRCAGRRVAGRGRARRRTGRPCGRQGRGTSGRSRCLQPFAGDLVRQGLVRLSAVRTASGSRRYPSEPVRVSVEPARPAVPPGRVAVARTGVPVRPSDAVSRRVNPSGASNPSRDAPVLQMLWRDDVDRHAAGLDGPDHAARWAGHDAADARQRHLLPSRPVRDRSVRSPRQLIQVSIDGPVDAGGLFGELMQPSRQFADLPGSGA
jgi:Salmonella virulence plasmid 65kDa B protein